jgi:hypothetical protein
MEKRKMHAQPSLLDGYIQAQPSAAPADTPQTTVPAETAEQKRQREADEIMRSQWSKLKRTRQVELQHNYGLPIQIHRGPRPTGKQIKKARAEARRAKKAADESQS